MPSTVVRVAVALSGGVDSAVVALLLKRCAPQWRDVEALCSLKYPLSLSEIQKILEQHRSWSDVLQTPCETMRRSHYDLTAPVHYFPVFMKNWEDAAEVHGSRPSWCEAAQQDYNDATEIARSIGLLRNGEMMPLHNFSAHYVEKCFEPMLDAYARGATLNVDILCNSEVKFHVFLHTLLNSGKAHYIATGHYARTALFPCDDNDRGDKVQVIARPFSAGRDLNDQTVFLSRLSTLQASKALFPLGHVFERKTDVRAVATYFGLTPVCKKKTSTGICFVGEHYKRKSHDKNNSDNDNGKGNPGGGFSSFLEEYIDPNNVTLEQIVASGGKTTFVNAETGNEIDASKLLLFGRYTRSVLPAYSVTLGQLIRGKDHDGRSLRYYVQNKELFPLQESNGGKEEEEEEEEDGLRFLRTVWLVDRWDHPLLYKSVVELEDVVLSLHPRSLGQYTEEIRIDCLCCARHQEPLRQATLCFALCNVHESNDCIRVSCATVVFNAPVRALTAGQALVAYWPLRKKCDVDSAASLFVLASGWIAQSTENCGV
ncbi:putative tRNA-methyl transferase [Trypanosoma theileri]|uniref:Putative tRNA-methyl transferase n=1 Tax=Trypanosoma theileri TaxID=67003 RepID=A0A1X0NK59_9TRYP|nr:putative tRNA-methyl transferase [Trypanosoma theileri]ORC85142.1 putative tRNA-methyl transferase [Trypanosoma theileri]